LRPGDCSSLISSAALRGAAAPWTPSSRPALGMLGASMNDLFLRACRREPVERTPVWYMRQAGRSQKEYRALRERFGILEICRTPELAAEVARRPVEQLGVDAAILFSDIVVPVAATGIDVRIEEGVGPVIDEPIRSNADVRRLRRLEP